MGGSYDGSLPNLPTFSRDRSLTDMKLDRATADSDDALVGDDDGEGDGDDDDVVDMSSKATVRTCAHAQT